MKTRPSKALLILFTFFAFNTHSNEKELRDINEDWRLSVGVGVGVGFSSSEIESDLFVKDTQSGRQLGQGTYKLELEDGISIDIGLRRTPRKSWGIIAGLTYESARKIKGGEIAFNSERIKFEDDDNDKLSSIALHLSAAYRWSELYIPFGINWSRLDYQSGAENEEQAIKGGIGWQVGLGYMINDNFVVEVYLRGLGIKDSSDEDQDMIFELKDGQLTSSLALVKYIF